VSARRSVVQARHLAARARTRLRLVGRVRALITDPTGRQSLVALFFNAGTSFVAGAILGSITGVFDRYPGLLVMVPAAIGLRGNISTTFGNRISTAIHMGEFRFTLRSGSLLRQNLEASFVLTVGMSVVLAVTARLAATAAGIDHAIPVETLALIAVTAGVLSAIVGHAITVLLAHLSVHRGWDLDNVVAPVNSTFGDVVTLPCLWLTSHLATMPAERLVGWLVVVAALAVTAAGLSARQPVLRDVTRQAWPILTVAVLLQAAAGVALEARIELLAVLPALLVLQPAFVSSTGALGGILSSRLATKLHLGIAQPSAKPGVEARADGAILFGLALVVFTFGGIGAHVTALLTGLASPGLPDMVLLSLAAGAIATVIVMAISYYGTVGAAVVRLDPDIYGIPVVTGSADFVGSLTLITLAVVYVLPA
jgi:mgtE-like transporter